MSSASFPLVLAFGAKMRQGKDTAAAMIMKARGHKLNIQKIAFADALRAEVNGYVADVRPHPFLVQQRLREMCALWKCEYDSNAKPDDVYWYGKQRALLQAIGQGRRDVEPDYWVNRWQEAVASSSADAVIVTDARYLNEVSLIKSLGGYTVKFTRVGYVNPDAAAAAHISENALNDYAFDISLNIPDGDFNGLRESALTTFDALVQKGKRTL